jgi:hypothetical protein
MRMSDGRIIGPCSKLVLWMRSEGFFDNKDLIDSKWLFNCTDLVLSIIIELYEFSCLEDCEIDSEKNNQFEDAYYSLMLLEHLRADDPKSFTFTDEDTFEWVKKYGLASILEGERREGNVIVKDKNLPLDDLLWSLTEKGKNKVKK